MNDILKKIDPRTLHEALNEDDKKECIIFIENMYKVFDFFEKHKVEVKKRFPFINAVSANVNFKTIKKLSENEYVYYITSNVMATTQNLSFFDDINFFPKLSDVFDGTGVTLAVLDTGISPHFDFYLPRKRIKHFVDLIGGKNIPYDDNGHGTFVSGVALGSGCMSNFKFPGVAKNAELVSVKCMNENGQSGTSEILSAMQWVAENWKKYDISVVCMALGARDMGVKDPLKIGAKALVDLGLTLICAGGNSGDDVSTIRSPASSPNVISVGGAKRSGKTFSIPKFSSRGPCGSIPKPDIVAPAVDITGCNFDETSELYVKMSGTSVATGIVAGVACLIKQKYPKITPAQIKLLMKNNAIDYFHDKNSGGAGLLNIGSILI